MSPSTAQISSIPALLTGEPCSRCSIIGADETSGARPVARRSGSSVAAAAISASSETSSGCSASSRRQTSGTEGKSLLPWIVQTRSACDTASKRSSKPSRASRRGTASTAIAPFATTSSIVNGTSASTMRSIASSGNRGDQGVQQQFLFGLRGGLGFGNGSQRPDRIGDGRKHRRCRVLAQRGRDQVDARGRVFGSGPARQLDAAKPAIRQFGDDCPGFIEQGNVGGRRPRADTRDPQPGAVRHPSERGRRAHPPETPRQKTRAGKIAAMPGLLVGDQRQQPLQRAVEQRGMNDVRRERFVDDRRIELRDRPASFPAPSSSMRRTVRNRPP